MNEYTKKLLRLAISGHPIAAETVWDAVGPNGIEEGWSSGRNQETFHLALALLIKDPDIRRFQVGKMITNLADAYLGRNAETVLRVLIAGEGSAQPRETGRARNFSIGRR